MKYRFPQLTATLATALILAYMGMAVLTELHDFSPWSASMLSLIIVSFLCGALLAVSVARAVWLIVAAAALAVLIFGGLWSYFWWTLLGRFVSLFEIALSDYVFLYVAQRGGLMFLITALAGLMGAVAVLAFLPERYLPKK